MNNSFKAGILLTIVVLAMFASSFIMVGFIGDLSPLAQMIVNSLFVTLGSILLPCVIFTRKATPPQFNIRPISKRLAVLSVCVGIGVCLLTAAVNTLFYTLIELTGANTELLGSSSPVITGILDYIIYLPIVCLLPAIAEEVLCRGILLYSWRGEGRTRTVWIVSIVFVLMHFSLPSLPALLIIALTLGFMAYDSRSVLPAIIVHFTNNFISLTITALGSGAGSEESVAPWAALIEVAVFGLLGLVMFMFAYRTFHRVCKFEEEQRQNAMKDNPATTVTDEIIREPFPKSIVTTVIVIMAAMAILNAVALYLPV